MTQSGGRAGHDGEGDQRLCVPGGAARRPGGRAGAPLVAAARGLRGRRAGGPACAALSSESPSLVDHFCASRRSHSPPRGHYQPALVSVGRRDARAARAANDDPRDEFARPSQTRRQGARGCSRLPAGLGQKCGAVDSPAKMAGDPVARLPGVPQWPPAPRAAAARADLMQPDRAKSQNPAASRRSTAVFRRGLARGQGGYRDAGPLQAVRRRHQPHVAR